MNYSELKKHTIVDKSQIDIVYAKEENLQNELYQQIKSLMKSVNKISFEESNKVYLNSHVRILTSEGIEFLRIKDLNSIYVTSMEYHEKTDSVSIALRDAHKGNPYHTYTTYLHFLNIVLLRWFYLFLIESPIES